MSQLLVPEQSGFRISLSIDNVILKLLESVYKAWNHKKCIAGVFCDLSRAFDRVAHGPSDKENWNFMELGVYI
jgi:hypothetical protein